MHIINWAIYTQFECQKKCNAVLDDQSKQTDKTLFNSIVQFVNAYL